MTENQAFNRDGKVRWQQQIEEGHCRGRSELVRSREQDLRFKAAALTQNYGQLCLQLSWMLRQQKIRQMLKLTDNRGGRKKQRVGESDANSAYIIILDVLTI